MLADAMATALMVMGDKTGPDFAEDHAISALFLLRSSGETIAVGTGAFA
jgi:thiamine biosynthesis lipoprotein ApbE